MNARCQFPLSFNRCVLFSCASSKIKTSPYGPKKCWIWQLANCSSFPRWKTIVFTLIAVETWCCFCLNTLIIVQVVTTTLLKIRSGLKALNFTRMEERTKRWPIAGGRGHGAKIKLHELASTPHWSFNTGSPEKSQTEPSHLWPDLLYNIPIQITLNQVK